ncbi:unnamed protein product [Chilo suppressalis]|uniref:Coiled-coil domain-containing protein 86 n=1 Tax=Chilo suppressalis TaxID=168631 RepID=A0ABN8L4I7_CHISP|nr:hypothetical protein evm_005066 [Chilo suppressalis]CAH2986341.1 unnamed protein product [Chilo suppressalis]
MTKNNDDDVLSIIANIKKTRDQNDEELDENNTQVTLTEMRGKPKSGRFWKSKKERFSAINKTKGLRLDFQKKAALRLELKRTKELSKQIKEQLKQKELERKERRRENIKKTEENKKKSEIVQVITNSAKLKRMKKKQLRFIQKRDTNKEIEANK